MKISKTLLFVILFIVAAIVIRVIFFSKNEQQQGQAGGKGPGKPTLQVDGVVVIGSGLDEKINTTGTLLANEQITLRSEVPGRVIALNIHEGNMVTKGDLLVKLNDSDLKATLQKLESNKKLITEKIDRQKKLLAIEGISQQEYDELMNQQDAVQSDIDFTKAQLLKTEIRAPFTGEIGLKNISEGSTISTSDDIASLQQINPVKLDFSIPEKYTYLIKKGDAAYFHVEGVNENFMAKIFAIEPRIDPETRTVKIRAIAENPNSKLFPGAFAKVEITLKKNTAALMIPTQAIIPVLKGKKVFLTRNGQAMSQPVETGIRTDKSIEITSGLQSGDTVITTGIMQLKDSVAVKVKVVK